MTGRLSCCQSFPPPGSRAIYGIVARGGMEVDIDKENGKRKQVRVISKLGNPCQIRYGGMVVMLQTQKGESCVLDGSLKPL